MYYTISELAELLKMGRAKITNFIKTGELSSFKIGKTYRISEEAVTSFLLQRKISVVIEKVAVKETTVKAKIDTVIDQERDITTIVLKDNKYLDLLRKIFRRCYPNIKKLKKDLLIDKNGILKEKFRKYVKFNKNGELITIF